MAVLSAVIVVIDRVLRLHSPQTRTSTAFVRALLNQLKCGREPWRGGGWQSVPP